MESLQQFGSVDAPRFLSRDQHPVSRKNISRACLKVLYRLRENGFGAFLVGGAVRDFFIDAVPRDFDVVTTAQIPEILSLFKHSRSVGKRYPIVHAYFKGEMIEITSLRECDSSERQTVLMDDALRRDFTINSVYYDIDSFEVFDPFGGIADIRNGCIRMIGDPTARLQEDPMRMVRAVKLMVRLGYALEAGLDTAIRENARLIREVSCGRMYEEITKLCLDKCCGPMLTACRDYGILDEAWPEGSVILEKKGAAFFERIRDSVEIHVNRGGFDRATHVSLWSQVIICCDQNEGLNHVEYMTRLFEPMRMPQLFMGLVTEAIRFIHALSASKRLPKPSSREIYRVAKAWLSAWDPDNLPLLKKILHGCKTQKPGAVEKKPSRGKRRWHRNRRNRGKTAIDKRN